MCVVSVYIRAAKRS